MCRWRVVVHMAPLITSTHLPQPPLPCSPSGLGRLQSTGSGLPLGLSRTQCRGPERSPAVHAPQHSSHDQPPVSSRSSHVESRSCGRSRTAAPSAARPGVPPRRLSPLPPASHSAPHSHLIPPTPAPWPTNRTHQRHEHERRRGRWNVRQKRAAARAQVSVGGLPRTTRVCDSVFAPRAD